MRRSKQLNRALRYAARELAVFPVHSIANGHCTCGNPTCARAGKHPRTPNGVKDATTEPARVEEYWKQDPDANIGVATGQRSDVLVLDVDGPEGEASLAALQEKHGPLPNTITVITGRGRHIYLRARGPISNGVGKLGPGLDHRGDGGYVVAAGSLHASGAKYRFTPGCDLKSMRIARAPKWLVKKLQKRPPASDAITLEIQVPAEKSDRARRYADTALARELERLAKAPQHQRNHTLNLAAFKVGQLLPYGLLDGKETEAKLTAAALGVGLDQQEIAPTIQSGLRAGQRSPRRLPFVSKDLLPKVKKEPDADNITEELANLGENDADNARRFARRHGDKVMWTPGRGWLVYDGIRWKADATSEVNRLAELTARAIADEAPCLRRESDRSSRARFATTSLSRAAITNMIELARPLLTAEDASFDRDPWLLNTTGGTIDLRTGERYNHDPRDLITRVAPVQYSRKAKCPQFLAFLRTIFSGDEEMIAFVQRALGYALTGSTREQKFFVLIGVGRNGKSTLLVLFRDLLGDYGAHTPTETLMVRQHDNGIPNDLARLAGKRMVMAAETNWDRRLDEAKIKAMTGGEPITARFMRQEFLEFIPQFKLFLAANDFPRVRSTAAAFWRRAVVIPFNVTINEADVDDDLPEKLKAEAAGILAWAVKGCLAWQAEGLNVPTVIKKATGGWQKSVDHIDRFVREELILEEGNVVRGSAMYAHYRKWCTEHGESPTSNGGLQVVSAMT